MNADDLGRAQYRALKNKLDPMAGYLHQLRVQMQLRGFTFDDPLVTLVNNAAAAVNDLHAEVFCRAMEGKRIMPSSR